MKRRDVDSWPPLHGRWRRRWRLAALQGNPPLSTAHRTWHCLVGYASPRFMHVGFVFTRKLVSREGEGEGVVVCGCVSVWLWPICGEILGRCVPGSPGFPASMFLTKRYSGIAGTTADAILFLTLLQTGRELKCILFGIATVCISARISVQSTQRNFGKALVSKKRVHTPEQNFHELLALRDF